MLFRSDRSEEIFFWWVFVEISIMGLKILGLSQIVQTFSFSVVL